MPSQNSPRPPIGMHGERIDWINSRSQLYHLGDGARSYDPMLQCFLSKDPYSPFSGGGANPYAFCGGDPVNRTDHSGYMSVSAGIGLGLGIFGIILGAITFGLAFLVSMTAVGALLTAASAVLGLASSSSGIAAAVVEDPELAHARGWVSLGLGLASVAVGMVGPALSAHAKITGRMLVGKIPKRGLMAYSERTASQESLYFMLMPEFKDGTLVITHGEPGFLQNVDGLYVAPDQWANELFALPQYGKLRSGPLYLMSCSAATANGRSPANAAFVANALRRDVYAFNSPRTGNHTNAIPGLLVSRGDNWGKLIRFSPQ